MILVKHVRDCLKRPFATIVAIDKDNVGISVCNPKDTFNKKVGITIAEGRARVNPGLHDNLIPKGYIWVDCIDSDFQPIYDLVADAYVQMQDRAKRYFK